MALLKIVYISVFGSKDMSFSFKLSCDPQMFVYLRQHLDSLETQNTTIKHINSFKVLQASEQSFGFRKKSLKNEQSY